MSLIKSFELDGHQFEVHNEVNDSGYTYFRVYRLQPPRRRQLEYERIVVDPAYAWADVMAFIKTRAGAAAKLERFLQQLKETP